MVDKAACPFCEQTQPAISENDLAKVILSNPRKVPGHVLVVPKRHIEQPWEIKPAELQAVFKLIFEVEQRIIGNLGQGVNVRQNYLPFIGQNNLKVDHVHFHVIPRAPFDYIHKVAEQHEDGLFAELDDAERKAVTNILKD